MGRIVQRAVGRTAGHTPAWQAQRSCGGRKSASPSFSCPRPADVTADDALRDQLAALLPRLRRFGRALTRHREDADDLVQLALERALRHGEQWTPGTRLDSWMFRIMKNAWIDETRARHRRDAVLQPEEAGEHVGVATVDRHSELMAVQQALAHLNEDQRLVVALVLVEGLPYKEAAQVLDVPVGTVTSRLARAREALQTLLGP
jgi:RNA polymerase sigma-70 factor (ECF subfamily)